jgi:tetraacyldisaccharide 4'-kinase
LALLNAIFADPMEIIRFLLLPISFIYGGILAIRNFLFDVGVLPSKRFSTPVISIGNLSVGGTGKTPMVENIIELLGRRSTIATLSRGYGRRSTGFKIAEEGMTVRDLGDEPYQFYRKYKAIKVAVDANRRRGIKRIVKKFPETKVIVLDDAYQHRYVSPSLSILLTSYDKLYIDDYVLPSGTLREFKGGSKRADIIVVTRTPQVLSPIDRRMISQRLNPQPYQLVFFSYMEYQPLKKIFSATKASEQLTEKHSVVLFTGIARPANLFYYVKDRVKQVKHLKFKDHHNYSVMDINKVIRQFENLQGKNKIILTTEKDAVRLNQSAFKEMLQGLPVYYIPIKLRFHDRDVRNFKEKIYDSIGSN